MSDKKLFNFNAPITDATSYGLVALNIIRQAKCSIFPIGRPHITNAYEYANEVDKLNDDEFDPNLPSVRLYHQFSLAESIGRGQRIGWPIFELDTFLSREKSHLMSCDKLIVCSEWAVEILRKNNITVPTYVVNLGVDRTIFNPEKTNKPDDAPYIFLSCGKYEIRKGQDQLVDAFNDAFEKSDNVQLWISQHNQFMQTDELNIIKSRFLSTKLGSKIKLVGPFTRQTDLAKCMNYADCGVFPSKAEGWGLETLEMMSLNKAVIVSNCTAHTEYCNDLNSLLIDIDGYEPAYDGRWFFNQGKWAIVNHDSLVERMRYAFSNRLISNSYGVETADRLSWENSYSMLKKVLL